ncbi:hypothetical protein EI94DRAFT_1741969 [Lactarius quietus]|nr:hypothetical protein EI94DRAFT_1741969 [Lactarius quietus]
MPMVKAASSSTRLFRQPPHPANHQPSFHHLRKTKSGRCASFLNADLQTRMPLAHGSRSRRSQAKISVLPLSRTRVAGAVRLAPETPPTGTSATAFALSLVAEDSTTLKPSAVPPPAKDVVPA